MADYQLSLDLTVNASEGYTPNLEIWLADGLRRATSARKPSLTAKDVLFLSATPSYSLRVENWTLGSADTVISTGRSWRPKPASNRENKMNHVAFNGVTATTLPFLVAACVQAAPIQWPLDMGGNGHYYEVVPSAEIDWGVARALAEERSYRGTTGHLVTITSATEQDFLASSFGPGQLAFHWLGGFQTPDTPETDFAADWHWVTEETWSYSNWAPGEPNNLAGIEHFLEFRHGEGDLWNDHAMYGSGYGDIAGYVVEYPVPEPATLSSLAVALAFTSGWVRSAGRRRSRKRIWCANSL